VRRTGGLADTVHSYQPESGEGTGFAFHDLTPDALANTVGWAASTWYQRPDHIQAMRQRAMAEDFSWRHESESYLQLYLDAYRRRRGHLPEGYRPSTAAASPVPPSVAQRRSRARKR